MIPDPGPSSEEVGITLAQVAELTGGTVEGDRAFRIRDLLPLDQAGPQDLGFLADRRYLAGLAESRAGALLVAESLLPLPAGESRPAVVVSRPHLALAALVEHLHPELPPEPGIHPTAVLGRGVRLGRGVTIGPYAVVEADALLEDGVVLGPHVVVGKGARVGRGSRLHPHVVLYPGVEVGCGVILHAGVRVGVDGFGYAPGPGGHRKVPQVGGCVIGDHVEIGANSCIDRGSIGRTEVGEGAKLDNLVHLGHNVRVGPRALLVAQVGVAGSSRIGEGAMLGGQAGISGHLEVGAGARVGAQGGVISDVPPGATVSGYPARPHREYLQAMAALLRHRDERRRLEARLRILEARLASLEGGVDSSRRP